MRFALLFFGLVVAITWAITHTRAIDHPYVAMLAGCLALSLTIGILAVFARVWKPLLIVGIPAFAVFCVYAWFAPASWPAAESGKVIAEYTGKGIAIVVGGIVGVVLLIGLLSDSSSSGSGSRRDPRMFYEKPYGEWDATDHGQFRQVQEHMRNRR